MKIIEKFIKEYNKLHNQKKEYSDTIIGKINRAKDHLTQKEFYPSIMLSKALDRLSIRAKEPMQIAVTGQFSSGKSTFLNALISKEILPTGITPVTSKVNFIKYADNYKLEIHHYDGRIEFYPIEELHSFTDQRRAIKDIKYLTIYAPYETLKDITFIDTPGLNSQSVEDSKTTLNVLKSVDGIIWISLIDNTGKMSEHKELEKILKNSNIKSLCVLNQKDRFSDKEIETTINHIKNEFGNLFDKIVPISSKLALNSRTMDKKVLIKEKIEQLTLEFKKSLQDSIPKGLSFFEKEYDSFKREIEDILNIDYTHNLQLLQESNINEVIDFIECELRANSQTTKEKSIKNELHNICDILIEQYNIFITILEKLFDILNKYCKKEDIFEQKKRVYEKELKLIHHEFDKVISLISSEIYANLTTTTRYRYQETKGGLISKKKIEKFAYDFPWFDSEKIYQNLFYNDEKVDKLLKNIIGDLKRSEQNAKDDISSIYNKIEQDVKAWQNKYEYISKERQIQSDREFANIRKFISRVYENVLKELNDTRSTYIAKIEYDFGYIQGALEFNYQNATKTTVAFFKRRIYESIKFYEDDPLSFKIYRPTDKEITQQVKLHFSYDKLIDLIDSNYNFLFKNFKELQESFKTIIEDKKNFIKKRENACKNKIREIESLAKSI